MLGSEGQYRNWELVLLPWLLGGYLSCWCALMWVQGLTVGAIMAEQIGCRGLGWLCALV